MRASREWSYLNDENKPAFIGDTVFENDGDNRTLREEVEKALRLYLHQLEDEQVTDLYKIVMTEVEISMFQAIMNYTCNNQSKASIMLGLNRGTLRKKLKDYELL